MAVAASPHLIRPVHTTETGVSKRINVSCAQQVIYPQDAANLVKTVFLIAQTVTMIVSIRLLRWKILCRVLARLQILTAA